MIGIIGAMSVEVEALKAKIEDAESYTVSGIEFVSGTLCKKRVVVAQCGIGKVFAAICAQTMILKYGVKKIINTGVAGTLSEKIGILDFAISDAVVQHDMDTTAIGDAPGLISGINIVHIPASAWLSAQTQECAHALGYNCLCGTVASGDQFINNANKKTFIRDTFGAIACEMEGAAIAHAASRNGIPFVIIRAISDKADDSAQMDYPTFERIAAHRCAAVTQAFAKSLKA